MTEKIELELLKLVFDYQKSKKDIDYKFIDKACEIVINGLGINEYVRKVKIYNSNWTKGGKIIYGGYHFKEREMDFNFQGLIEFDKENLKDLNFNSNETYLYIFISFLHATLHELIHAYQCKKVLTEESNLENILLKASFEDLMFEPPHQSNFLNTLKAYYRFLKYINVYRYDPKERLAEHYSYNAVINISKMLNHELSNLINYLKLELYYTYLAGYDKSLIPTQKYLKTMGYSSIWRLIDSTWNKELSPEDSIAYGLYVPKAYLDGLSLELTDIKGLILKK